MIPFLFYFDVIIQFQISKIQSHLKLNFLEYWIGEFLEAFLQISILGVHLSKFFQFYDNTNALCDIISNSR